MNTKPDEYYIDQTLKGNVNAYAFLVEKYKQMVFTLAVRIVKNREGAEEISQDAFVKAYSNLSKFEGKSKFSTWLYKITYFASLDEVKRKKRTLNYKELDAFDEDELGNIQDAVDFLHQEERKKVIQTALFKLKEEERVILTLYYFEELPIKEIAKIVNLSDDNVKIKLFRSRKKLVAILKNVIEPRTADLL